MIMYFKIAPYCELSIQAMRGFAYSSDCGFLVGVTESIKHSLNMPFSMNYLRYKRAQVRIPGLNYV